MPEPRPATAEDHRPSFGRSGSQSVRVFIPSARVRRTTDAVRTLSLAYRRHKLPRVATGMRAYRKPFTLFRDANGTPICLLSEHGLMEQTPKPYSFVMNVVGLVRERRRVRVTTAPWLHRQRVPSHHHIVGKPAPALSAAELQILQRYVASPHVDDGLQVRRHLVMAGRAP